MEKRIIIFLILSLAIIIGYDYLLKEMELLPPPRSSEQSAKKPATEQPRPLEAKTPSDSTPSSAPTTPSQVPPDAATLPLEEQTQEVDTGLFRAVFTSRGATIKSWELKKYMTSNKEDARPVQLAYGDNTFDRPLSLRSTDPALTKQLNEGLYRVERDFTTLDASHPTGHLTFTYQQPQTGLRLVKRLTFRHDAYLVDIAITAEGLHGSFDLSLGTNFGIVEWGEGFIGLIGPASLVDDALVKDLPDAEQERKGSVRWVALQDKYFLSALMPTGATAAIVRKEGDKLSSAAIRFPVLGSPISLTAQLYAGPKEYDRLKALNVGLEDTIDFGWFIYGSWNIVRAVAKPLFYVLRFLYEYTHNYGIAIILLTVAIKLLFVPLQYKSYKSMKEMQHLQPKVAAIQQKYQDDRERLNRELIKLYREHKVNPLGGCLPVLLQTPVFVALFNILYMTIDLRQAPFMLWITDLSSQDPYYVLPIIMGATMVLQQKMTPTTMDPTQAKIMLLLPAFLTLLFLTFPSGLVLYWLTNNLLTIAQQFVTDRYIFKKPTPSSPIPEPTVETAPEYGQKSAGKKKKDKATSKAEADTQVET